MNGLIGVTVTKTMSRAQMPQDWDLIDGSIMYASEKMWASAVDGGKFSIAMMGQYQGGAVLSHNVTIHPDEFYVLAFDMAADPGTGAWGEGGGREGERGRECRDGTRRLEPKEAAGRGIKV